MNDQTQDRRRNWTPARKKAHAEKMKQAWAGKKADALVVDEKWRPVVDRAAERLAEKFGFKPTATQTLNHIISLVDEAERETSHSRIE